MSEQKPTVPEFLARLQGCKNFEPYLQAEFGAGEVRRPVNVHGTPTWRATEGKAPPTPDPLPIGTVTKYGRVERCVVVNGERVYWCMRDNVAFTLPAYLVEPTVAPDK